VAESLSLPVFAPGGQSGNFWIHPRTYVFFLGVGAAWKTVTWKT